MGLVTSEIEVGADTLTTFRTAIKIEQYPEWMPSVKSVKVLERRDDGYAKIAWVAIAKVASINKEVKWTEEAWWDEKTLSCHFELLEGDYTHYKGSWEFTPVEGGTKIRLSTDYDLGLPLVGPLIGKLLDKIMRDNLDGMLKAIKERAEEPKS